LFTQQAFIVGDIRVKCIAAEQNNWMCVSSRELALRNPIADFGLIQQARAVQRAALNVFSTLRANTVGWLVRRRNSLAVAGFVTANLTVAILIPRCKSLIPTRLTVRYNFLPAYFSQHWKLLSSSSRMFNLCGTNG
jgi:hypothetical protein